MEHYSPADILRSYLLTVDKLGLSLPSLGSIWPVFVSKLPDDGDQAVCIYDTQGLSDGRIQNTGETIRHPGLMIKVRARDYRTAYNKIHWITKVLDDIKAQYVLIGDTRYTIQAVNRTSDIIPLGEESHKRRESFVINARITFNLNLEGI